MHQNVSVQLLGIRCIRYAWKWACRCRRYFGLLDCGLDSLHADIACQHCHREEQGPPPRPPVHGPQALGVLAVLARGRACNHEPRTAPCAAHWILHAPVRPQRHVPCFLHIPRFSRLRLHALLFHLRLFPGVLVSHTLPLHGVDASLPAYLHSRLRVMCGDPHGSGRRQRWRGRWGR